jgi:hypothetical protein
MSSLGFPFPLEAVAGSLSFGSSLPVIREGEIASSVTASLLKGSKPILQSCDVLLLTRRHYDKQQPTLR